VVGRRGTRTDTLFAYLFGSILFLTSPTAPDGLKRSSKKDRSSSSGGGGSGGAYEDTGGEAQPLSYRRSLHLQVLLHVFSVYHFIIFIFLRIVVVDVFVETNLRTTTVVFQVHIN